MPFSESIPVGGNGDIINATTTSHGPSLENDRAIDREYRSIWRLPGWTKWKPRQ